MTITDKKRILKSRYLKPKKKLREARLAKEYTDSYMGNLIGVSREHYGKKERGEFPFNDYEMQIIADVLDSDVGSLFYNY